MKRAPENKSVWAFFGSGSAYLRSYKSQPDIFPLTPRLGANENKDFPCGIQNKDTILEQRIGRGGDMRELGHISLPFR